jgi:hypothetical protein
MPVYEYQCVNPNCLSEGETIEIFRWHQADANPPCAICGQQTDRVLSTFATPWLGTIDRFNLPGIEGHNSIDGGHIAYRTRSSRLPGQAPEPVRITTRQEQLEYCRAEGLHDPTDINPHMEFDEDGTTVRYHGMKGAWGNPYINPFEPVEKRELPIK